MGIQISLGLLTHDLILRIWTYSRQLESRLHVLCSGRREQSCQGSRSVWPHITDSHGKTMGEMSLVFPGRIEAI